MNSVEPQKQKEENISLGQNEDHISVETNDPTSTRECVLVEQSFEQVDEISETRDDQANRDVSSSIKFLQALGLPTFENEDPVSQGTSTLKPSSYWNALYVFPVIGISMCSTFYITLIPQSNVIEFPNYWFEHPLKSLFSPLAVLFILDIMLTSYFMFNAEQMISFETFFQLYIPSTLTGILPYCILMTIWTLVFEYNPPMPFAGLLVMIEDTVLCVLVGLKLFAILKSTEETKILLKALLYALYVLVAIYSYDGVTIMIEVLPSQIQWIVSIVLPMLKGFHTWAAKQLLKKTRPCNLEVSLVNLDLWFESNHAFYEALILANVTEVTMYSMLVVQFLMHLYSCYQIIRLHRKVQNDSSEFEETNSAIKEAVFGLVLSETLEVLIPLVYAVTFVTTFFGPNAGIMGNFRNSYWQFEAIDGVEEELHLLFTMVGIDVAVGIISAGVLWVYCNINIFLEFCQFMKTYWSWTAIKFSTMLFQVF